MQKQKVINLETIFMPRKNEQSKLSKKARQSAFADVNVEEKRDV